MQTGCLVLGSGGSVLNAAILAVDQRAEIWMLEKLNQIGGKFIPLYGILRLQALTYHILQYYIKR